MNGIQTKNNMFSALRLLSGLVVIALLGASLLGCATPISEMSISSVSMEVENEEEERVEALLPEQTYYFDFRVIDESGQQHINPNYRDFRFEALRNLSIRQQAFFSVEMRTPKETFHAPGTELYGFTLSVENNPFPAERHTFPLDWEAYDTVDYSGRDGRDGEGGDRGRAASGESADEVRGGRGGDGEDGEDGRWGKDVRMLAVEYSYDGSNKILLYEFEKERLFLTDVKKITIDASGGDGGRGGAGGRGGPGADYIDPGTGDVDTEGIRGFAGDGGNGGDGGSGGDIELHYTDPGLSESIRLRSEAGEGGYGGSGYRDGGRDGRDGFPGETQKKRISGAEAREILSRISRSDFELERVSF